MAAPGYTFDTAYTPGFYREQTPDWMRYVTAWSGVRPPPGERFRYLDLGCGLGRTATWVAAFHPEAEVWGIDAAATHIAQARAHAADLGIDNVHFEHATFGESLDGRLPMFDFISLHGVWSWVADPIRQEILAVLSRHLNPGGLFYIGYNAMPGKAPLIPVHRLLRMHRERMGGSEHDFDATLELLKLVDGAGYFGQQSRIVQDLMSPSLDKRYLMHEYWVENWEPLLFSQIADSLGTAGLSFVGSAVQSNNVELLSLAPQLRPRLEGIRDPIARETVRDYLVNAQFRRDVFVKGRVALDRRTQLDDLMARTYCLHRRREDCELSFGAPSGRVTLEADPYDRLLDAMVSGPLTGHAIAERVGLEPANLVFCLGLLAGARHVTVGPPPDADREARLRTINAAAVQVESEPVYLGSTVADAHRISKIDALLLGAGPSEPEERALQGLWSSGLNLLSDTKNLDTPEKQREEMGRIHAELTNERLPLLASRGVVV